MISSIFKPSQWRLWHFGSMAAILTAINLLGPRGVLHLYYIKREQSNLTEKRQVLNGEIRDLEKRVALFHASDTVKRRLIKQRLGLLEEDELSVEFIPNSGSKQQ